VRLVIEVLGFEWRGKRDRKCLNNGRLKGNLGSFNELMIV
jgi:hypothetical protein